MYKCYYMKGLYMKGDVNSHRSRSLWDDAQ